MNALDEAFSANHFQGKDVLGGNAHNLNDDDIWGKKTFVSLDEIQSVEPRLPIGLHIVLVPAKYRNCIGP